MKKIELYAEVKTLKDIVTRSSKPITIKAGSFGYVVDIIDHKGKTYYLVELDSSVYGDGVLEDYFEDEIEVINK